MHQLSVDECELRQLQTKLDFSQPYFLWGVHQVALRQPSLVQNAAAIRDVA
jgi:hypothetical protein